jgi:hypothetical protein
MVFTTFAAILVHYEKKLKKVGFWEFVARIVLKNRISLALSFYNGLLALQWKNIQFSLRKLTYCGQPYRQ